MFLSIKRSDCYVNVKSYKSFRPLTGIMFFNPKAEEKTYTATEISSFRPLTGIVIFNAERWTEQFPNLQAGFRPLTGIMIFSRWIYIPT